MQIKSVFRPNLFVGKVAIVTGGATGIGAAITQELCYLGCDVVIASRNEDKLKRAAELMNENEQLKEKISHVRCDIRKESDVKTLVKSAVEKFGRIDFLVNNGGGQFVSPVENISANGWNAVVETNLTGAFYCCKQVYLDWMSNNGGTIVNIIADMWRGMPGMAHTSAARAGVENLTKTLSLEWAESKVRINSIAPGVIYSPTAQANYHAPEFFQGMAKQIPAQRLGLPEEISAATCFLLSPAASFITGETMKVDGGESLYGNFLESLLNPIKQLMSSSSRNPKL